MHLPLNGDATTRLPVEAHANDRRTFLAGVAALAGGAGAVASAPQDGPASGGVTGTPRGARHGGHSFRLSELAPQLATSAGTRTVAVSHTNSSMMAWYWWVATSFMPATARQGIEGKRDRVSGAMPFAASPSTTRS